MIRVAVLLSGQIRHWQTASKLFKFWNGMDSEVNYDFFISTWDDSYRGENAKDADLSMCVASEVLPPSIIDPMGKDFVRYPYLLKRANLLKNAYEIEQGFKYNTVLATRPDVFLGPRMLNDLVDNIKRDSIGHRTLFIDQGVQEKKWLLYNNGTQVKTMSFIMNDFYVYGHSIAVDTFAEMYDDMIVRKTLVNNGVHTTPAHHVIRRRLNNRIATGFSCPIRYTNVQLIEDWYESGKLAKIFTNLESNGKNWENFKTEYQAQVEQYVEEVHINPHKIKKNEKRNFSRKL